MGSTLVPFLLVANTDDWRAVQVELHDKLDAQIWAEWSGEQRALRNGEQRDPSSGWPGGSGPKPAPAGRRKLRPRPPRAEPRNR